MSESIANEPSPVGAPMATGLVWAVKDSFLAYLGRMPDLQSSVTDGAIMTSTGAYFFPTRSTENYDATTGRGVIEFAGDVRFSGHHGMMFVRLAQPRIEFGADGTTLSVSDSSGPDGRLPLLDVRAAGWSTHFGARAWPNLATTLRPEALEIFNDIYPAGEEFAPLDVRVGV